MKPRLAHLALLVGTPLALAATDPAPAFRSWAPTPPMGWNSWDNFGTAITEAQTRQQAEYMAAHLKSHGWQYVVVDIQWYQPTAKGHGYKPGAALAMDDHGRLLPATNRFPSAAGGAGFKPLADYIHSLGLKFGIHLMRGIPRQAVERNVPILGTDVHAADIANRASICPWNPDMYGVDTAKPGAQAYYDSVFSLIASWGVDFVKVDDISRPYLEHENEIEAIRRAIDRTGRPIVLSLSPGETALAAAAHVQQHANMWRISDDFWDRWLSLREQFGRLAKWNPYRLPGAWPDADMLPLGVVDLDSRASRFSPDEQRTLMTLWSIARSPLMHGGDMTRTDPATLALLTNDEVLAVDQHSVNNRRLFDHDGLIAWIAQPPESNDRYFAVFNTRDRVALTPANARFVSNVVTSDPATDATIDVGLQGGTKLFLVLDPTGDGSDGDNALWRDARLVLANGEERSLADLKWTHADALWDSTTIRKDAAGRPIGLAAQAASVTEYALPADAVRFKATGMLEHRKSGHGSVRFLVVVATPENENNAPGIAVPVTLTDLGFSGPVRIRDLWTHRDLGEVSGTFAPEIPFHGAGLYR
ncbi:MAG TPA: hypothetical protein VHE61_13205, partial [Opitutaceae bacterium]|nr:hypothetical protein [Opitutaceae bacterium]